MVNFWLISFNGLHTTPSSGYYLPYLPSGKRRDKRIGQQLSNLAINSLDFCSVVPLELIQLNVLSMTNSLEDTNNYFRKICLQYSSMGHVMWKIFFFCGGCLLSAMKCGSLTCLQFIIVPFFIHNWTHSLSPLQVTYRGRQNSSSCSKHPVLSHTQPLQLEAWKLHILG